MPAFQPEFIHQSTATRTRFGPGARYAITEEIEGQGARRALILTTPGQAHMAEQFTALCGPLAVGRFSGAVMHTPVAVSDKAAEYARQRDADMLISVGGGSAIGLGKAIALRTGLPQIAVPTTYSGSEATPILGQTQGGLKTTLRDPVVQPGVIIYDAELVATLPLPITVTSALNAMAHAVEALYATDRTPLTTLMAVEGLRAFHDALPGVRASPGDLTARGETLYGAWLCGTALGQTTMGLHHKLCHMLGGSFGLPHAQTHAVILPHVAAYNAQAVPELLAPVARIFGHDAPGLALHDFARAMGAPLALRDLGMAESDLDRAADLASASPYSNPRPATRRDIRALLQAAWDGVPPAS